DRSERLVAAPIALPLAVAAGDEVVPAILVARLAAVRMIRPVVAELPAADLEEQLLAEHRVPLTLPDPRPVQLLPRRDRRDVDVSGVPELERVEARRLVLAVGGPERDE